MDDVGDHAPDFKALFRVHLNGRIFGIFGHQPQAIRRAPDALDRQFAIQRGHHHLIVARSFRAVHDEDVSVVQACVAHGIAADAYKECGGGVPHKVLVQVKGLVDVVVRRGGKARLNGAQIERKLHMRSRLKADDLKVRAALWRAGWRVGSVFVHVVCENSTAPSP